jgi:hypothetical protein
MCAVAVPTLRDVRVRTDGQAAVLLIDFRDLFMAFAAVDGGNGLGVRSCHVGVGLLP